MPPDPDQGEDELLAARRRQFTVRRDPRQRLDHYLRQRLKHKDSLGHAGVRDGQARSVQYEVIVEQNIQIDGARPPPHGA